MCCEACQDAGVLLVGQLGQEKGRVEGAGRCREVQGLLAMVQQVLAAEAHIVLCTVHVIL